MYIYPASLEKWITLKLNTDNLNVFLDIIEKNYIMYNENV